MLTIELEIFLLLLCPGSLVHYIQPLLIILFLFKSVMASVFFLGLFWLGGLLWEAFLSPQPGAASVSVPCTVN